MLAWPPDLMTKCLCFTYLPSKPSEKRRFFTVSWPSFAQIQLKGHRSVGGMRASIYNSMPMDGVLQLATFMADFRARNA